MEAEVKDDRKYEVEGGGARHSLPPLLCEAGVNSVLRCYRNP